uniref:Uncharacterized protein n=1 Tax=Tanacetum cinerariifolium TaxID=118510 RepID=A0A699HI44_TANCI|nr:hypothetical protein [Tanacetum cinerariifolium]
MIHVKGCRPMGVKDIASWDLDNSTWGGWGEVIGTVLVDAGAQESCMGEKQFWREFLLRVVRQWVRSLGNGQF